MIAIIKADFNSFITNRLLESCQKELKKSKQKTEVFEVPGVLEIGYIASKLLDEDKYEAVICLGCVIKGDTYHFEVVSNESARAITELNLIGEIPFINGILTCYDVEQAEKRVKKGSDFAKCVLQMMKQSMI